MTEKELISRLQSLKQIKPRENWAVFAKSRIFENNIIDNKSIKNSILSDILRGVFQKKLVYSFATFLFVVAGLFGFMKYGLPNKINSSLNETANIKIIQQYQENLVAIKSNVEDFKAKSKNLSQISKSSSPEYISLALREVNNVAKELANAISKDPKLAKEVALDINNSKTYLNVQGGDDLKETSNNLYKILDEQMIKDLESTTLTESQQEALRIAKDLYSQVKYSDALESILLLNMAIKNN